MKYLIILFLMCNFIFAQIGFTEKGYSTYYSDKFHGRPTASGEKYDKNELTCAHKTLPFNTMLKVTNLNNKKSVIVRVIDRGPFRAGYHTDLSRKAAEQIDMINAGVCPVTVEVVGLNGKVQDDKKDPKDDKKDPKDDKKEVPNDNVVKNPTEWQKTKGYYTVEGTKAFPKNYGNLRIGFNR